MPKVTERLLRIETPPGDVNLVHELLAAVRENSPEVPIEERYRSEAALIESASNVMRYATSSNGVSCTDRAQSTKGQLVAELRDTAHPEDVRLVARVMPDDLAESGRGIPLSQALVDEWEYSQDDGYNLWRITRRFAS